MLNDYCHWRWSSSPDVRFSRRRPAARPATACRPRPASWPAADAAGRRGAGSAGRGRETSPSASRHSNHWPRSLMMPSSVCSTDLAAAAPSSSTALGFTRAMARSTNGAQTACSCGRRRAVAGRAPEDGVGDEDPVRQARRRQHPVQQLAGLADEGLAALRPRPRRGLADDQDRRRRDCRARTPPGARPCRFRGQPSKAAMAAARSSSVAAPAASRRASAAASLGVGAGRGATEAVALATALTAGGGAPWVRSTGRVLDSRRPPPPRARRRAGFRLRRCRWGWAFMTGLHRDRP